MKRFLILLCSIILGVACLAFFAGCGETGGSGSDSDTTIPSVKPDDKEPDQKPDEKPDDKEPELKEFTGITLADGEFTEDGSVHKLEISGTLPAGARVAYENNEKKDAGTYTVKATITAEGYKPLTLTATMTVKKATSVAEKAQEILRAVVQKPNVWEFIPKGLQRENMAHETAPVTDFTNFVNTGDISKRFIGKQLNALYGGLERASALVAPIDTVMTAGTAIASVYQAFINKNPDDYANFSGEAAGWKISVVLDGKNSTLLAGNSTVSIELKYDGATQMRYGRVQITNGSALKYEYNKDVLKLAVKGTVSDVGYTSQVEFARAGKTVAGVLYEYIGTSSKNIKTTAQIAFDDQVAVIFSDKRETDDLKIRGYEEVYNAETGEYLGGEVAETVKIKLVEVDFDTLWFSLSDVTELTSVKVSPEQNGLNADMVYLNGSQEAMHTKLIGGLSMKAASRRYDVEMKEVWYFVKKTEGEEVTYEKVKTKIPILFVQTENAETFGEDFKEKNDAVTKEPLLPAEKQAVVTANFKTLEPLFADAKKLGSFDAIVAYIGDKNSFFENETV